MPLADPHPKTGIHSVPQPVEVQSAGTRVATRRRLNFAGDTTVTHDPDNDRITVTTTPRFTSVWKWGVD